MRIQKGLIDAVKKLPRKKREQVEAIVRRHLAACRGVGVEPENMDRVWIEAMEMVEIDRSFTKTMNERWPEWESLRRYDVYENPKANW